jgi:hypothetical protein
MRLLIRVFHVVIRMNKPTKSATRTTRAILCLFPLVFPALVSAQQEFYAAPYVYQTNADGSATLTGYTGPGGSVVVPTSISSLPVTGLYNTFAAVPWFPNVTLTNVTIPSSVLSIGDGAFYCCASLTNITIPSSVTNIGYGAFQDCAALSAITIPASVTSITDWAFADCSSLSAVTIPGNVASIGDSAFQGCASLTNVAFSSGLTNIGEYAFAYDELLNNVVIPNGVMNLAGFPYCTALTNVTIPESVINIEDDAFLGCTKLANAAIPGTVTNIGNYAFEGSSGLTSITIAGSVGNYAFAYCTSLTNATLSNGVGSIGDYAFCECGGLTSIVIPGSVNSIGVGSFSFTSLTNLTMSNGVSVIGGVAFCECGLLTSVTIPPSVQSIGEQAFWDCNKLTNVFFQGNAPASPGDAENGGIVPFLPPAICYYLPGTTGWSNTYHEVPAVLWNPLIQTGNGHFGVQNNQFGFDITGTPAIPIVVEATTNLANPVWTPLTNVTLTNGLFHFTEPTQPNTPSRYYRIGSP